MRVVVCEGRQTASAVAARSLHLDDIRAEIGEELGTVRTCDMVCEVKDADAL